MPPWMSWVPEIVRRWGVVALSVGLGACADSESRAALEPCLRAEEPVKVAEGDVVLGWWAVSLETMSAGWVEAPLRVDRMLGASPYSGEVALLRKDDLDRETVEVYEFVPSGG